MLDFDSFEKIFPKNFTKKLKESIIPLGDINRTEILKNLYEDIVAFKYHPSTPRDYILVNKSNYVARITTTFHPKDYFLYYFCTKILEDEIAEKNVEGTFGGWRLGNQIRLREAGDELSLIDSVSSNSYNPFLRTENWSEFQKKAYEYSKSGEYGCIVKLDIANFYDNINIDLLGRKLYLASPHNKLFYVNLLIYFLNNWNKKFEGYTRKIIGLPQDEIGDSSRLLANFYIQGYDNDIKTLCTEIDAKYLRYADDQIFYTKTKKEAERLVFESSKLLSSIGLNLNTAKVEYFEDLEKFNQYWAFEMFELLGNKTDSGDINKGIKMFLDWKNEGISFREWSILKRILNLNFELFENDNRSNVLIYLIQKDFISMLDNWSMNKIYGQLSDNEKESFLKIIEELLYEYHFNFFHYNVIEFYKKNRIIYEEQKIFDVIQNLKI